MCTHTQAKVQRKLIADLIIVHRAHINDGLWRLHVSKRSQAPRFVQKASTEGREDPDQAGIRVHRVADDQDSVLILLYNNTNKIKCRTYAPPLHLPPQNRQHLAIRSNFWVASSFKDAAPPVIGFGT